MMLHVIEVTKPGDCPTDVFFIPASKSSFINLGQLDEKRYEVKIRVAFCQSATYKR
jgi:hypothetical protein